MAALKSSVREPVGAALRLYHSEICEQPSVRIATRILAWLLFCR